MYSCDHVFAFLGHMDLANTQLTSEGKADMERSKKTLQQEEEAEKLRERREHAVSVTPAVTRTRAGTMHTFLTHSWEN